MRDESEADWLDRNFGDLLQELRVAQAGGQHHRPGGLSPDARGPGPRDNRLG